jgi:hypothetical protein
VLPATRPVLGLSWVRRRAGFSKGFAMFDIFFSGIYSPSHRDRCKRITDALDNLGVPHGYTLVRQSLFQPWSPPDGKKCHWCGERPCRFAFHSGLDVKIHHQLQVYLDDRFKDRDVIVVYTDCDIELDEDDFWEPMEQLFRTLTSGVDIVWQQERERPTKRWPANINLGLTAAISTFRVRSFYRRVLARMRDLEYPRNWDQQVVNQLVAGGAKIEWDLVPNNFLIKHSKSGGRA